MLNLRDRQTFFSQKFAKLEYNFKINSYNLLLKSVKRLFRNLKIAKLRKIPFDFAL